MQETKIAIIGGSGLYDLPGSKVVEQADITTPFGKPSDQITIISIDGIPTAFLPRHGRGHVLSPSELPVKANIWALKSLGVEKIISISAVGSLREEIAPEHFVLPDQIIDRTKSRPATFFEEGIVGHISFADPFCGTLRGALGEILTAAMGDRAHLGGTYVCMEGPAFSTQAESHLYRSFGASVIGMTALPEAKLAREAEICYAQIAMSTDYDCWRESEEAVSVEMIISHMQNNTRLVKELIGQLVSAAAATGRCAHQECARQAIITAPDKIPPETRKRLDLLYGKYL